MEEEWKDSMASAPCCQQRQLCLSFDGRMTAGARGAGSMETQGRNSSA